MAHLNIMSIYKGILTLENIGTVVNYRYFLKTVLIITLLTTTLPIMTIIKTLNMSDIAYNWFYLQTHNIYVMLHLLML